MYTEDEIKAFLHSRSETTDEYVRLVTICRNDDLTALANNLAWCATMVMESIDNLKKNFSPEERSMIADAISNEIVFAITSLVVMSREREVFNEPFPS